MLLTWLSAVIGLSMLTLRLTELPLSANNGNSSFTRPVSTLAPPVTFSTIASTDSLGATAARAVANGHAHKPSKWARKLRRGNLFNIRSVAQSQQISDHVL